MVEPQSDNDGVIVQPAIILERPRRAAQRGTEVRPLGHHERLRPILLLLQRRLGRTAADELEPRRQLDRLTSCCGLRARPKIGRQARGAKPKAAEATVGTEAAVQTATRASALTTAWPLTDPIVVVATVTAAHRPPAHARSIEPVAAIVRALLGARSLETAKITEHSKECARLASAKTGKLGPLCFLLAELGLAEIIEFRLLFRRLCAESFGFALSSFLL